MSSHYQILWSSTGPIKLHCSFADGTERTRELTESQRTEILSVLGDAIVPGLDHGQDTDLFGGVLPSVFINFNKQFDPSGEGYLENGVEQQQVDSASIMTQDKKPLSAKQEKHRLGEHGSVRDEMVVSPSNGSPRSIRANQQADQRSHDDLEAQQHPRVQQTVRPFCDGSFGSIDEQRELLGECVPDSEGPCLQDTKVVTATTTIEPLPPVCHTPSSSHKAESDQSSRTVHHPESEVLKDTNKKNYKEVLLKQRNYLPRLLPPQAVPVEVEKESRSDLPEIPFQDTSHPNAKVPSSAKPRTPKIDATCAKAVTVLEAEAIAKCRAHLAEYKVALSEQELLACIQHHLHPSEKCSSEDGEPCGDCGVSVRQLDTVLAYIGVITEELEFGSSCGITRAVAEKHLEACRQPADCFLLDIRQSMEYCTELEQQARYEYGDVEDCLNHLTDCQVGLTGVCPTCIFFADTVKYHMQQCQEPCCYLILLAASKIPSLEPFLQGRVIASTRSDILLGEKLNCLETKLTSSIKLGQGGCGCVYSAYFQGHSLAVKIQRNACNYPDPLTCPVEKFWKLFTLRHPHVLHEMAYVFKRTLQSTHNGLFGYQGILVMNRYSGDLYSYQKKLKNSSALKECTNTTQQIIVENLKVIIAMTRNAMEYCHRQGLVHLDIKGPNFLVRHTMDSPQCNPFLCSCPKPCYCLVLADFDFTRALHLPPDNDDRYLQPYYGRCAGTRYFMSPQRRRTVHGKLLVDPAEDRYSLGVMWAWMLIGDPNEDNTYKQRKSQLHNDYQSVIQNAPVWLIGREYFDAGEILAQVQTARRHSSVPIDEIWNSVESYIQPLRCDRSDSGKAVFPVLQCCH